MWSDAAAVIVTAGRRDATDQMRCGAGEEPALPA
jgi:hypothetical protein